VSLGIQQVEATDGDLVRRVLAGDAHAYAGLVGRHRDRLMRYARHVLGNREDAEEAVQDAFVRAFRSLERCDGAENYGRWLFGILVNRCRTRYGQTVRRSAVVVHDDVAMAEAQAPGTDEAGWGEAVRRALDRLDPVYREAFLLKHVEDLSYEEMAELTGTGVSALKMRVSRACERLRVMLEEVERV
jgi:RNA polymerase sigma-70 factor (ECF subfamily)